MSERSYFLYEPEANIATIIDPGEQPEKLRQYLFCLATGIDDAQAAQDAMQRVATQPITGGSEVIHAGSLFHADNSARQNILDAAKSHSMSSRNAVQELSLLNWGDDEAWLVDENGIMYDAWLQRHLEHPAEGGRYTQGFYDNDSPEEQAVLQLLRYGIDDIRSGLQFEFDPFTLSMYSDRSHEILGSSEGDHFVPILTVLSDKHPVRQLITQGGALGDDPAA